MRTPEQVRDASLRGAILKVLRAAQGSFNSSGIVPAVQIERDAGYLAGEPFVHDEHVLTLLRELAGMGMVELFASDRVKGQLRDLRHYKARILDAGCEQLDHVRAINPRVDDGREID